MVKQLGYGRPALLLHSSMSSHRQWLSLASGLSATHSWYLPDLAGYGVEPLPAIQPWSLAAEADLLLAALPDTLKAQPLDLIGHSYGGALALHLARTQKLQIRKLVLFEPVAFHVLPQLPDASALWQEVRALADALPTLNAIQAAERFIDYWQHKGFFAGLPVRMQQQLALQVAKVSLDFQALSQEPASLADYADAVKSPVLLLSGSHSRQSAQRISAALRSVLPDVRLQRLECGHMGPVTHPDLVNKPIANFLLV